MSYRRFAGLLYCLSLRVLENTSKLEILKSKEQVDEQDIHHILLQRKSDIFMNKNSRYYDSDNQFNTSC